MKKIAMTKRDFRYAEDLYTFLGHIRDHQDRIVFRYFAPDRTVLDMTYTEFYTLIRAEAAGLEALGLAGKRIAIIGDTSPAWLATYLAVTTGGGVAIPMDKELAVEEIAGLLESVEADAIVYGRSFNEKFAGMIDSHKTISHFIPMFAEGLSYIDNPRVLPYDRLIEMGKEHPEYEFTRTADTHRLAEMLFTSGTTGTSKCVMLSEQNIVSSMCAACSSVDFSPEDTIVSVLPIHHTYELCCILAAFNYGATVAINDSLKHVLRNFALFKPTGLVLVPLFVNTMYKKIWDEAKRSGRDGKLRLGMKLVRIAGKAGIDIRRRVFKDVLAAFGGRLTKIISGGAPLNPEMIRAFDCFGIRICEGYGITECSPLISVTPYYSPRPGSVGPAVETCTVRIDGENTNEKGYREGEILVKGTNVMLGYYHNDAENAKAFTEDGWYRTGDVGYMDEDGFIYITGRLKSVIVLENGKNVFPEEIEEYISQIDEVLESVVVGRHAPDSDEIILTAILVPNFDRFPKDTSPEEIEKVLRARIMAMNKKLASFKQVRNIEIRNEEFEKTTSRKIRRHLVK